MKYLPIADLLDSEPANIAIFSTYQLDPDFFERQLLRCATLGKARRILVFLDASQWYHLLRQDSPSRSLNWKYLVVPVHRSQGVFHPKLNLLLYEKGGQVQCGSNNLTRSGCSSNLELLNAFNFGGEGDHEDGTCLAQEAFAFFKRVCDDAEEESAKIARKWLEEATATFPWLAQPMAPSVTRKVRLVHTYEGNLWERIAATLDVSPPSRLLVISPFHDLDGEMFKRVLRRWPRCRTEVLVQQQFTSLPINAIAKLKNSVSLSELRNSKRRLHAKLVAWETEKGTGCLVGSANFTAAAFDARNVETCLIVSEAADLVKSLFDKELSKRGIKLEEFVPGTEQEPKADESPATRLRLTAALLFDGGQLRVSYTIRLPVKPSRLRVAVRTPGEPYPRAFGSVPIKDAGSATVSIPSAALGGTHGTILASLIAEFQDHEEESAPVWVIQEDRLTHEPSGEGSSSAEKRVKETGEGLTEILEEIAKRDGVTAVIEYLRNTDIRFNDGGGLSIGRRFRLRVHDPFHPDVASEWLINLSSEVDDLASAIRDFVERHERRRLRKHAKNGNVNGMENFLDIFTALVRLLYVYHKRTVQMKAKQTDAQVRTGYYVKGPEPKEKPIVAPGQLVGQVSDYIQIATGGIESDDAYRFCQGYLDTVSETVNNPRFFAEVARTLNFGGEIKAALMILQMVRFKFISPPPRRPNEGLPTLSKLVKESFAAVGIAEPSNKEILTALEQYRMFTEQELADFRNELERR